MSELTVHPKKVFVENVQKWDLYERQLKLIAEKTGQSLDINDEILFQKIIILMSYYPEEIIFQMK
jgi:hypothetical protein